MYIYIYIYIYRNIIFAQRLTDPTTDHTCALPTSIYVRIRAHFQEFSRFVRILKNSCYFQEVARIFKHSRYFQIAEESHFRASSTYQPIHVLCMYAYIEFRHVYKRLVVFDHALVKCMFDKRSNCMFDQRSNHMFDQ
jgi:hypothetical protein